MNQALALIASILFTSSVSAWSQTVPEQPKGPNKSPKKTPAEEVLIALDWTPNTNHTGLYAAQDLGYFKDEHLQSKFLQQSQTNATILVGTNKAHFGISFMSDMFKARAKGIPVKAIAAVIQSNTACFAWRTSSGIKSVKDWEGKKYGGWGSPEEAATLKYIMEKNGADFSKLTIVTTGIGDFIPSTEKNADFMWVYMGWGGIEARLAGVSFGTLCGKDIDPVFDRPSPLLIASETTLNQNPELVKRFLRAAAKGYTLAATHPKTASEALMRQVPELKKPLVLASAEYLAPEYMRGQTKWGAIRRDIWSTVAKWMSEKNLIAKVESPDAYFTNDHLP
jgi:ABC-type nitrate/sulfonate/bicarbonate transport system substrate-binding protein